MKVKKLIALTIVACLLLVTPASAGMKTHWMKASGTYYFTNMTTGKGSIQSIKWSRFLSKKQEKEALKLLKNNPRKLYKKYKKKIPLDRIFKSKIKGNTLTIWGKFNYVSNGIKKKCKFGKYKFKLSQTAVLTHQSTVASYAH